MFDGDGEGVSSQMHNFGCSSSSLTTSGEISIITYWLAGLKAQ